MRVKDNAGLVGEVYGKMRSTHQGMVAHAHIERTMDPAIDESEGMIDEIKG